MNINTFASGLLEGQEDCLYINVYRPEAGEEEEEDEPQELLPVSCTFKGDHKIKRASQLNLTADDIL